MLEVAGLSVAYGHHVALQDVALAAAPGEIAVVLGANGAGKSTLLKAIAGLVPKHEGAAVRIDGMDVTAASPDRIVEAGIALVPEGRGIFRALTVEENLQLGAYARRARGREGEIRRSVMELFPKLAARRRQRAGTMSGGEQQMVAIGRALMSNPSVLMLDEPSLGLSPLLTSEVFKALAEIRARGVGVLMVEQNARKSIALADRGYLLETGRVVRSDSAANLAGDPQVQAAYLGG